MGDNKNYDTCPYGDNACWPAGKTPNVLVVTIAGVTMQPDSPYDSPNGTYNCIQRSPTYWTSEGYPQCQVAFGTGGVYVAFCPIMYTATFFGIDYLPCHRHVIGFGTGHNIDYGAAAITFEGAPGTPGSNSDLAEKLGMYQPETVQFEHNPAKDQTCGMRMAQKRDGSLVYIKIPNEL